MLTEKRRVRIGRVIQLHGLHLLSLARLCDAYADAIKTGHRMTAKEVQDLGASMRRSAYRADRVAMVVEE